MINLNKLNSILNQAVINYNKAMRESNFEA
jgi:hypothetical protein